MVSSGPSLAPAWRPRPARQIIYINRLCFSFLLPLVVFFPPPSRSGGERAARYWLSCRMDGGEMAESGRENGVSAILMEPTTPSRSPSPSLSLSRFRDNKHAPSISVWGGVLALCFLCSLLSTFRNVSSSRSLSSSRWPSEKNLHFSSFFFFFSFFYQLCLLSLALVIPRRRRALLCAVLAFIDQAICTAIIIGSADLCQSIQLLKPATHVFSLLRLLFRPVLLFGNVRPISSADFMNTFLIVFLR